MSSINEAAITTTDTVMPEDDIHWCTVRNTICALLCTYTVAYSVRRTWCMQE